MLTGWICDNWAQTKVAHFISRCWSTRQHDRSISISIS